MDTAHIYTGKCVNINSVLNNSTVLYCKVTLCIYCNIPKSKHHNILILIYNIYNTSLTHQLHTRLTPIIPMCTLAYPCVIYVYTSMTCRSIVIILLYTIHKCCVILCNNGCAVCVANNLSYLCEFYFCIGQTGA